MTTFIQIKDCTPLDLSIHSWKLTLETEQHTSVYLLKCCLHWQSLRKAEDTNPQCTADTMRLPTTELYHAAVRSKSALHRRTHSDLLDTGRGHGERAQNG